MPQILAATALVTCLYLLSGCGQMGPLYLPEDAPPEAEATTAAGGEAAGHA